MFLDYSFEEKSMLTYVVQEWRQERWYHVCCCPDVLTAEREARYRFNQNYLPTRVVRVRECEIAKFK